MKKGVDHIGVGVVFFCHDGGGNFVMAKRNSNAKDEHGRWDIGGGGVEHGEYIEDALRREVLEEYCAEVISHEFLGFRDVHRTHEGKQTHWIALDFKVLVDPKQVQLGEPHKFDGVDWFTLESIPEEVHSQLPKFLEDHGGKLNC